MQTTHAGHAPPQSRQAQVPARSLAAPGGAPNLSLLSLHRSAGNQAVSSLIARVVQRCGPVPCNCSAEEREQKEAASATSANIAQRTLPSDLRVKGKFPGSKSDTKTVYFDYAKTAFDSDEDAKLVALTGTALSTIKLKGFASEEGSGGASVVDGRLASVARRLEELTPGTGSPTKVPDLTSSEGSIDYRSMRKVEILVGGAVSPTPDCSGGADIDCGPSPNQFTIGHAQATSLIASAISALSNPTTEPARTALTNLFKGPANAAAVKDNLTKIQGQLANMLPAIPLHNTTAGGHRCINQCEGDVFAYNQGIGASARMTVGPRYLSMGNPEEQGLALIHEGSHGTTGLSTDDHAYRWQRLLPFLSLSDALDNADSYAEFISQIKHPGAPSGKPADTFASSMSPTQHEAAARSLAWLEQYLVQGRLEFRSLYSAAHRAHKAGAWQPDDLWYRDNTMKNAAPLFGMTIPPAVPSAESKARIAGVYDRLAQLRYHVTGGAVHFDMGSTTRWEAGPGSHVTLSAAFFVKTPADQVWLLLDRVVGAASFIESARKPAFVAIIKKMGARFGGP
jgi:lysine-specific metallo-endopeptidase family protein